jgi:RimJ/RimL family protein N-acetyltransferase
MTSEPVAHSSRIALRPVTEGDIPALADGCADPEIARFIPIIPQPYTLDDARAFVEASQREWLANEAAELVIEDRGTGEFLGIVSVSLQNDGSTGYWIKPNARKDGVATEALRLAVQWARETHNVSGLFLTTHPKNVASQRVAEKSGFRRVGAVEQEPPFSDGEPTAIRFEL